MRVPESVSKLAALETGLPALAAFDLDGTLLGPNGEVSWRTAWAVRALAKAGTMTVIATGRPWPQTAATARRVGCFTYAVCLNGAVVMDARTGEQVADSAMGRDIAVSAVQIARRRFANACLGVDMADGRHLWEHQFAPGMPDDFLSDLRIDRVDDVVAAIDGPVLTWLVDVPGVPMMSVVRELEHEMPLGTEIRPSGLTMAEIAVSGVCKSAGLQQVCEWHGIDAADVAAFGDGLNDVDMLAWAGRSWAMDDAPAEVRLVADEVAPSNAREGVAQTVEAMLEAQAQAPEG